MSPSRSSSSRFRCGSGGITASGVVGPAADLVAPLAIGRRLVAFASRGPLIETRSPSEHKTLRATLGRLLTYEQYHPDDIAVALVPRSRRFRALATRWRQSRFIVASDMFIVTIDRTGSVEGFPIGQ